MKRSVLVFLIVLLFTSPLFSQMPWEKNIRLVDIPVQNNTPCGEIIDGYAVGVDDLGVTVWSLENPDEPRPHYRLPLPGSHWEWFRNGDYLYVESNVDNAQYIDIVDISNPEIPEFRNRIQIMDNDRNGYRLHGGYIHGNFIYLVDYDRRILRRFSLQDPINPVLDEWEGEWVGGIQSKSVNLAITEDEIDREYFHYLVVFGEDQPDESFEIDIERGVYNIVGDLLLCRTDESLIIYDISNPRDIRQLSQLEGPYRPYSSLHVPYKEKQRSMVRFGDYVAVTADRDLYIIHIGDPENPELLLEFENELNLYLLPLFVNEDRLYVIANYHPMQLPYWDDDLIMIFDISDPENTEIINEISKKKIFCSSYDFEYMNIRGDVISMVNCRAYFSSFRIGDIEAIPLNTIHGDLNEEGEWPFYPSIHTAYNGNLTALSIGDEGISIYDLADPENPQILSNIEMEPSLPIIMNDSLLLTSTYLGDHVYNYSRYNVEEPNNPELVSQVNFGGIRELVLENNFLFYNNLETSLFEAAVWEEDQINVRFAYDGMLENFKQIDSLFVGYTDNGLTFLYPDIENEGFVEIAEIALPQDFREIRRSNNTLEPSIGPNGLISVIDYEEVLLIDAKYPENARAVGSIELPYRIQLGAQWVGNEIYAKNFPSVMRLRPAMNNDDILLSADTLDFGRHTRFSITNMSYTLSIEPEEGLSPILNWGLEGDSGAYLGNFGVGWVAGGDDLEFNVRFRPLELGRFESRIWYETENGIIQIVLLGLCSPLDVEEDELLPKEFYISEVYPNPFNSSTTINYYIPYTTNVVFSVYDLNGKEICRETRIHHANGDQQFTLNLIGQPTGEYFIKINAGEYQALRKVLLVK